MPIADLVWMGGGALLGSYGVERAKCYLRRGGNETTRRLDYVLTGAGLLGTWWLMPVSPFAAGSPKYARMLSSFAYSAVDRIVRSRAFKEGIQVLAVNPAFTSLIGRLKFSERYGLTVHQSAALVIGRRSMGLSERPPKPSKLELRIGTKIHGTLSLPVRIAMTRGQKPWHVWSWWRGASKAFQSAVEPHHRALVEIRRSVIRKNGCSERDEEALRCSRARFPSVGAKTVRAPASDVMLEDCVEQNAIH